MKGALCYDVPFKCNWVFKQHLVINGERWYFSLNVTQVKHLLLQLQQLHYLGKYLLLYQILLAFFSGV